VGSLHLVFATASGNVRRNKLSDFRNVRASGLIAMKLDEGDRLIGVATCREGDDVLLATKRAAASASRLPTRICACSPGATVPACAASSSPKWRRGDQPLGAAPCRGDAR
jgi:DNA gyrase/topoisomerase IV subunit A